MISLSHLTMRLAGGGHQITILDDVTLEIPDKQRVAIVGHQEAGSPPCWGSSLDWIARRPAPSH
jgi:putative ABC transport system ATP-binding protein